MSGEEKVLSDLVYGDALKKVYRQRKPKCVYRTVPSEEAQKMVDEGWSEFRRNKNSIRLFRPKPVGQALEDETWSLMARMGFTEMNGTANFKIPVAKKGREVPAKQIDVFAKDEDTVLMIECKAREKAGRRPLQKDIGETYADKGPMATVVKSHYGKDVSLKIAWVFVTRNIIWSNNDLERAMDSDIHVMRDDDLDYYQRLAEHIGAAARHQLQADIFRARKVPGLKIAVPALRGKMGGKTFYSFMMDPSRLLKIAFVSHRAKIDEESLVSYQRMLKKSRLKRIAQFIENKGIFPTSIVVNLISHRPVHFDVTPGGEDSGVNFGTLYLPDSYKSAWIIDGQHRLYGFADSPWATKTTLPVIAFENLPAPEQARMFIDINHEQVKVQKSLLVDLAADLYWDSPDDADQLYALHSKIAADLGLELGSPLRGRIATEGKKLNWETPITLTGTYESLRKTHLVGTIQRRKLYPGPLYETDAKKTRERAVDILARYLSLFADALPDHWELGNAKGGFLCTNNGIGPLFRLLAAVVTYHKDVLHSRLDLLSPEQFIEKITPEIKPVVQFFKNAGQEVFQDFRRNVAEKGQQNSAFAMMQVVNSEYRSFNPPGLQDYIKSQDRAGTEKARQLMPDIQLRIQRITLTLLRERFGDDSDSWWRKGVPQQIRAEVAARRERNPEGGELEEFFELLDYKKIADRHWMAFQDFMGMGSERKKEKKLGWFDKLNKIRNRVAHPERGPITEEEVDFLHTICDHLEKQEKLLRQE